MATDTTSTAAAPYLTVQTLQGAQNTLELLLGLAPAFDPTLTQNAKFGFYASTAPTAHPTLGYFGIGIGGSASAGAGKKLVPNGLSAKNLGLYNQLPFRVVPVDQDLNSTERALYAGRATVVPEGTSTSYIAYWFKRIVQDTTAVQLVDTDPNTGLDTAITLDPSELTPVPPAIPSVGSTTAVTAESSALFTVSLPITGSEVLEAIDILHGGDMTLASIDEIGIFTGQDQTMQATDSSGNSFSYLEGIAMEMFQHRTMLGIPFFSQASTATIQYDLTSGNLCVVQNGQ